MYTEMLKKTMLIIPMLISGLLATTLNQAVVPSQPGRTAGPGGSFHHMTPNGKVMGEYEVELPDGRTQHVIYTADHHQGYIANISYRGEAKYPSNVQKYTTPRNTKIYRHPSRPLENRSYNFGGKITEDSLNKPTPQQLTPTPVNISSLNRTSGIVISEPQYGYKAWYPQPDTNIGLKFDSKYNSKTPSSSFHVVNNHKSNKTRKYLLQTKQSVKDQAPEFSSRFPNGSIRLPTASATTFSDLDPFNPYYGKSAKILEHPSRYPTKLPHLPYPRELSTSDISNEYKSSETTLDPFYPHYGKSAKLLKHPSRYPTKIPHLPYPRDIGTEYKKSNIIHDVRILDSDEEFEPLYIPKYFDFAIKKPPQPYLRI